MSIGSSGRIVLEVDPNFKRHLYATLAMDGMSLKMWFLREAERYMATMPNEQKWNEERK